MVGSPQSVCAVDPLDRCYDQAVAPCPPMSKEQLKAFLEKVNGDTSLQEKLKAAESSEDVVSMAKEHGHDFGTEHITQLSEEELEGVAGGIVKKLYAPFADPAHYAKCLRITGITADD